MIMLLKKRIWSRVIKLFDQLTMLHVSKPNEEFLALYTIIGVKSCQILLNFIFEPFFLAQLFGFFHTG